MTKLKSLSLNLYGNALGKNENNLRFIGESLKNLISLEKLELDL